MALTGGDLQPERLAAELGGRPVRSYPAVVSTEADALAWARAGAPDGAVVVADYQAAPRGRSGLEWRVEPGRDLAFSGVVRPRIAVEREGWLYTLGTVALAETHGNAATIDWPDGVHAAGDGRAEESSASPQGSSSVRAAIGIRAEPGANALAWAVINVLVPDCPRPRSALLARLLTALDQLAKRPADEVLAAHRDRCATIGRRVCATLLPLGPNAVRVTGTAATTLKDGALVIVSDDERRVAVRPQSVGTVDLVEPLTG